MSKLSFIDAIDSLKFSMTGVVAVKTDLAMGLTFECESKLSDANDRMVREMEIAARFGGKMFIDEAALDSHTVEYLVSMIKSDMKRIAFSDALDFAQSVVAVAAKNGNRELLKMAFDFQDRILKSQ